MKKHFFTLLILLLTLCLYNCGDSRKKENTNTTELNNQIAEEPIQQPVFKINLNLVIPNDDTIEVFYLDFDDTEYSYKTKVAKKVKGNPNAQGIEFLLPKKVFPYSLRIDFGQSGSEENVTLNSVAMFYEDFELILNAQEFYSFFIPNQHVSYNKETGVIERILVDGKYDPYFNARALFKKKLELEVR
jgi:hypothetical protein